MYEVYLKVGVDFVGGNLVRRELAQGLLWLDPDAPNGCDDAYAVVRCTVQVMANEEHGDGKRESGEAGASNGEASADPTGELWLGKPTIARSRCRASVKAQVTPHVADRRFATALCKFSLTVPIEIDR